MAGHRKDAVRLFYSYSHRDEAMREELEKHLSVLRRTGIIKGWHDRAIDAGSEWKRRIDENLEAAHIILLLVSADFLASDYCWDIEMRRAMERHKAGKAVVIPVILHSVDWAGAPFAKLQALPKDAVPVSSWANRAEAFADVAKGIRAAVEAISRQASAPSPRVSPASFSVAVWTAPAGEPTADRRDIWVAPMSKQTVYQIGDRIVVCFRASCDCYLTLLNIGSSGKLTVLFPNSLHRDNRITGNRLYQIPSEEYGFEYELIGPPGVEKLRAIATLANVQLLESQFAEDGSLFRTVESTAAPRDIAVVRKRVEAVSPGEVSESDWQFQVM